MDVAVEHGHDRLVREPVQTIEQQATNLQATARIHEYDARITDDRCGVGQRMLDGAFRTAPVIRADHKVDVLTDLAQWALDGLAGGPGDRQHQNHSGGSADVGKGGWHRRLFAGSRDWRQIRMHVNCSSSCFLQ